ncbi:MAG: DNA repair exonuclease [Candidatus Hodarchaeaceae archaeon]|nr:DNA repair exonuclease [Candidatus Hodarchaeaceae archaeon]
MKIAVISDTHLGAKWGTPREQDSFDQAREAIERALELGAQLILILGDIFDTRIPRQEIWPQAMRILALALAREQGEIRLSKVIDKNPEDISAVALQGSPIVALHGNHERRVRGLMNPVEALEAAGFLIHLHQNVLVFETPAGDIAIHGMSNVPERHAKNVLSTWNPKPVNGAFNILMLHQAVGQYVFSSEECPTLDLSDLPLGFDLYLCGHMHYHAEAAAHGKSLLFPGSTERTQLLPIEAQVPKGFYMLYIDDGLRYEFVELQRTRDFYYEEMIFDGVGISQLNAAVREKLQELLGKPRRNPDKLPLIRLRLRGTLAKDASRGEFDHEAIIQEFSDNASVTISKDDLIAPGLEEKMRFLRELREHRLPVDEMAMRLLDANLRDVGYDQVLDFRVLYDLLIEDRTEEALDKVFEVVERLVEAELKGRKQ